MANDLMIPDGFGAPSAYLADDGAGNDELSSGVVGSYAVLGYRGKNWWFKYRGEESLLEGDNGDPVQSVEVILIKSASTLSKTYYPAYDPNSKVPPVCWSSNGQTPDANVQNPQAPSCAACPRNVFGSRITESGKGAKECSDAKRIAVVPLGDIENDVYGGPMLLRVPAASLGDMSTYANKLTNVGHKYYGVGTRLRFDPKESFPKLVFSAIRKLTDDEVLKVLALRDDPRLTRILSEATEHDEAEKATAEEDIFEQPEAKPVAAHAPAGSPVAKAASIRPTTPHTSSAASAPGPAPKPVPVPGPGTGPNPKPLPPKPATVARPSVGKIAAAVARPAPAKAADPVEENHPYVAPAAFEDDLDATLEGLL